MFEHIIGHMRAKTTAPGQHSFSAPTSIVQHREMVLETIAANEALSRRGLWGMLMFITISGLALQLRGVDMFAGMPEGLRCLLGVAPPVVLIHLVLGISTISSLIIILGRSLDEEIHDFKWTRLWSSLGFRSVFYLFYATANALEGNFILVFTAGIIILAAEHFTTWRAATRTIKEKKEYLAHIR